MKIHAIIKECYANEGSENYTTLYSKFELKKYNGTLRWELADKNKSRFYFFEAYLDNDKPAFYLEKNDFSSIHDFSERHLTDEIYTTDFHINSGKAELSKASSEND